jgi:hypothetical protein
VVVVAASASVLGRLLSSSAPEDKPAQPCALRQAWDFASPETAALFSLDLAWGNSQEFSRHYNRTCLEEACPKALLKKS